MTLKAISSKSAVSFPKDMTELEVLADKVAQDLRKYFDIALTKKKSKLLDYTCSSQLGLRGGFQQLSSHWKMAHELAVDGLDKAKKLPEQMYILINDEDERLYMIESPNEHDLKLTKKGIFSGTGILWIDVDDPESNEGLYQLSPDEEDALNFGYHAVSMAVNTTCTGGGSSQFSGSVEGDSRYLKDKYGITPCAYSKDDSEPFTHFAANNEITATLVLLIRPSDEEIDKLIGELEV